jgi:hypothetical protein
MAYIVFHYIFYVQSGYKDTRSRIYQVYIIGSLGKDTGSKDILDEMNRCFQYKRGQGCKYPDKETDKQNHLFFFYIPGFPDQKIVI